MLAGYLTANSTMRFDIVTLFPAIFSGYLTQSLLAKAIQRGLVEIHVHDLAIGPPTSNITRSMTVPMAVAPAC